MNLRGAKSMLRLNSLITDRSRQVILICLLICFSGIPVLSADSPADETSILDSLISNTGLSRNQLRIPLARETENGIIAEAHFPTIRDIMINPFYLPGFCQVSGAYMNGYRGSITPSELFRIAREMVGCSLDDMDRGEHPERSLLDVFEQMQIKSQRGFFPPEIRKNLDEQIQALPEGMERSLVILCEAYLEAALLRRDAISGLTEEEFNRICKNPMEFLLSPEDPDSSRAMTPCGDDQREITAIMRKVNLRKLFFAGKLMLEAIEETRPVLQWINSQVFPGRHEVIMLSYNSPFGKIVVGGPGINRYEEDAALIVDIGGSDIYQNNCGGSLHVTGGISCVIDVGGNDIYESQKMGVQGSGILGVGILVDYNGTDTFYGGNLSQGVGFGGLGLLYDERGSDKIQSRFACQGAGIFGIGLLIKLHGNDFLVCESMGQGFGSTMGIGVCVNVFGKDHYMAGRGENIEKPTQTGGFSQGAGMGFPGKESQKMGLWGGIGFLVDGQGDDTYFSSRFSQGAAGYLSLGMLLDGDGDDLYDGRHNCQGAGINYGAAILVDHKGHDQYFGIDTVQAAAVNHSVAMLLDYTGIDRYKITGNCGLGFAEDAYALAFHLDYDGSDQYRCGSSTRGVVFPSDRYEEWSLGVFLNLQGEDQYYIQGNPDPLIKNNSAWYNLRGAAGMDTDQQPSLYFTGQEASSRIQHYDMSPVEELEGNIKKSMLGAEDPFARFHALQGVINLGSDAVPVIVKAMQRGHNEFRRVLEEGIELVLQDSTDKTRDLAALMPLLENIDPETRKWLIHLYIRYKFTDANTRLHTLLTDAEADVRGAAVIALGSLETEGDLSGIKIIAKTDPDSLCRQAALRTLAKSEDSENDDIFLNALRDLDPGVFQTAAEIIAVRGDRRAVGMLQLQASSENLFRRRVTGKTLILLGDKSGFPVLIDTLKFCGNTSFRNLPCEDAVRFLTEYTGAIPGVDVEAWQRWWIESEIGLDLSVLLEARLAYASLLEEVIDLSSKELLAELEKLQANYPDYRGFDDALSEVVYEAANTSFHDGRFQLALKLSIISVDMDPSPLNHAVYAQALYAGGKLDKALEEINLAIAGDAQNQEFRKIRAVFNNALEKGEDE